MRFLVEMEIVNEDTQHVRYVQVGIFSAESAEQAMQRAIKQYPELADEVLCVTVA